MALAEARAAGGRSSLKLRVISTLVLVPLAIAAVWFGSPWLTLLTALAGGVMAWEWARLCGGGQIGRGGAVLICAVPVSVADIAIYGIAHAVGLAGIGGVIAFALAAQDHGAGAACRLALGLLWIAVPCVLLLWLARPEIGGRAAVLWIFAIVWATDIGAYAVGRLIGGPRLAPRWSPGKTWAGLIGGIVCAALAGWGTARLLGLSSVLPVMLVSAGLAIIEQFGDLAESMAKRRFGVKDSSGLIPGHGGLLDRLDGLLAVVPAVALLSLAGGGVLQWR